MQFSNRYWGQNEKQKWEYKQLYVDVPGQGLPSKRIYLERNM